MNYTPCQCTTCRPRAVYGVCRCKMCAGATPAQLRTEQEEQQRDRVVVLLHKEDGPSGLEDDELAELERLLFVLTRS